MLHKTNAARALDDLHINYRMQEYAFDEDHLNALHVANELGVAPELIYKTLVLVSNIGENLVAVIPANQQLDLKKIATASNHKKCEMIAVKDLLKTTGYIRGGCSPLGMKKVFPVFIEEMATLEEEIIISAGKRGLQLVLKPQDLATACKAHFADLIA